MPTGRKRRNEDHQRTSEKRRRTERGRNGIATGECWAIGDVEESMGETIILNQALGAKGLLPTPVTDPDDDKMDIDHPSPPEITACQPSEPRDLTVQGQGKTGWDGDGEKKYTHRSVEPEAMVILPARDYARLVAYIPPDSQGYAPTTPAGPLTTQTSADKYNGPDAEYRLEFEKWRTSIQEQQDRMQEQQDRMQEQQASIKKQVDKNEEDLRSMLEEDKRRREAKEAARQEEKAKKEQRRKRKEEEQQKRWEEEKCRKLEEGGRRERKEEEMTALMEGIITLLRGEGERKPRDLKPPAPPTEAEPSNGDTLLPPPASPQLGSKKPRTHGLDVGSKTYNTRSKGPPDII